MAALPELMIMNKIPAGQHDVTEAAIYPGLGLFNGAIVDQNFDAFGGRLERFTGLLKNTAELNEVITWPAAARNMIGLAVGRNTAIIIQGNTIQLIGQTPCGSREGTKANWRGCSSIRKAPRGFSRKSLQSWPAAASSAERPPEPR